ncbi:head-tail adaptor protein [Tabrizicola fusiformis]|uniref:head-tail adaptor protein n=1 Tax=Tabrizicola sp. SY72 TaxID=2741673 RepID=UPI00157199CC|nr:head-tail adaptor protein [Tabrizicola sp. SY72]NTT86353.1 head-tail adaptor protein [Tabrizicola sp. SY72]
MSGYRLTRALVLEDPQEVADGAGGFGVTWVALGTLWAEVRPGAGREAAGEEVLVATTLTRIFVRGAPEGSPRRPRPEQRFREGDRIFTILAVAETDSEGRHLVCHSREEAQP